MPFSFRSQFHGLPTFEWQHSLSVPSARQSVNPIISMPWMALLRLSIAVLASMEMRPYLNSYRALDVRLAKSAMSYSRNGKGYRILPLVPRI